MGDEHFNTTLAYTKSPQTSRRTTFQEELESAVSARASRHKPADSNAYSDDFDDDEDDILSELLKTRKKKIDMFKTRRTKAKINDFQLSDDEEENVKPKKVSFMKTKRKSSPVQDVLADSGKTDTTSSAESPGSFLSYRGSNTQQSTQELPTPEKEHQDTLFASQTESQAAWMSQMELPLGRKNQSESYTSRKSLSESPLPLNSENSQWEHLSEGSLLDLPLLLSSAKGEGTIQAVVGGNGESPIPQPRERSGKQISLRGLSEEKPPRPMPRQRTSHVCSSGCDEGDGLTAEASCSKAVSCSTSITLSPLETAWAAGSNYVQCEEDHHTAIQKASMSSSSALQQGSEANNRSLQGPDWFGTKQDNKEHSMPFKEYQEGPRDMPHLTASRQSEITINSQDRPSSSRPVSSRKSKNATYTAKSRYLGTLKVLDQKTSFEEIQQNAVDSLRAAAYQDWLRKKQEKLQETLRVKKQEEELKQDKKTEDETSKKVEAEASYLAWKEKKQLTVRSKLREKQETRRKQQQEAAEKEEKQETAKKVFEKWKQEHDTLLREQIRRQVQVETRLQEKNEKEQEERKKECSSSFSQWSERKKEAIQEKARAERRKQVEKEMEEKYEKEEREMAALETYEKWLRRKEFLQKREKQEKKIRAIVEEETPPPWSPPGRTIPFGK
ncbi:microtubule-associated protein 9 isoform X2 [Electrophorus electricus]|uniref:microtubule-associated protein 9 isoform X2 n=1 Tax=Electrophorus electricus TaxID=8005 RepID=UPI0015D0B9A0|nr:microtubule-associated protein 9 isoform X2 [Electrophorus electricus]